MLTVRFKELEESGIIIRDVYLGMPVHIEYSLMHKGET
ncbi:winged helix-turn-helix transcriptional regulator [Clostridium psychrophilum]|nr:winged helix-turn-helix transcriptional regulator [Clostridium psychrophilum]MBU3181380.1 winged helix-turn-helix transcriptional regulator [Clostridium psychrophilum]